jgi:hypothetical protein
MTIRLTKAALLAETMPEDIAAMVVTYLDEPALLDAEAQEAAAYLLDHDHVEDAARMVCSRVAASVPQLTFH